MKRTTVLRIYTMIITMLTVYTASMAQTFSGPIRYVRVHGNYANDGTSWASAKNNLQDAIESLNDYMTRNGITKGRVYVAKGTYSPTTSTPGGDGVLYTSFLIYEGITVYGGFSETDDPEANPDFMPEATPEDRIVLLSDGVTEKKMSEVSGEKWRLKNTTILSGRHSSTDTDPLTWSGSKNEYEEAFTGNSYHVVWFATNTTTHSSGLDSRQRAVPLTRSAGIDGFTIRDGNASNRTVPETSDGSHVYHTSYGAGIYMVKGAEVRNCIIMQNASSLRGGGVYMDGGGLLEQCHVYQNQAGGVGVTDGYGGGVACDDGGIVRHCIIEDNAARCGGGLSITRSTTPENDTQRYASFATGCVVSNNTSSAEAGGVYLRNGGLLNHLTITKNNCVGPNVIYNNRRYGRSGGLFVDGGGMIANTVIWGNEVKANNNVQYATYRESASTPKVRLEFVALSKYNYVDWSGTIKHTNAVYAISEENRNTTATGYYPDFVQVSANAGAAGTKMDVDWTPNPDSYLIHRGMQLNDYPSGADRSIQGTDIIDAHLTYDLKGLQFVPRCVLGAYVSKDFVGDNAEDVECIEDRSKTIKTVFVDADNDAVKSNPTDNTAIGASWDLPFHNINDALYYIRTSLSPTEEAPVQVLVKEGTTTTAGNTYLPHIRSSYIDMPSHVRLYGGFASSLTGKNISKRNPKETPTRITANITDDNYGENGCHIITIRHGVTDVIVDGLQLYFANAQTNSVVTTLGLEGGAGIAVINSESDKPMEDIIIRNCVVANNTASMGSALFLRNTPGALMDVEVENCIFHNNAVTKVQAGTIEATGSNATLTLNHCLVRGNIGYGVMATDNATIKIKNSALHANVAYGDSATNMKITDLTATADNADPKVVTFFTTTNGTIKVAEGATNANNMMDLGMASYNTIASPTFSYHSSNTSSYPKFINPTSNIGVNEDGDVTMYGGDPNWMPTNTNPMVNAANETGTSATDPAFGKDMTTIYYRNYGGAADIGAIENHNDIVEGDTTNTDIEGGYMPPYGRVIYVRDYRNADGTIDTSRDGDGSSWQNAINGNLESVKYTNKHGFRGVDAELYDEGHQLTGLQWAVDEAFYRSLEKNDDDSIKYSTITGVTHFNPGSQNTVNSDRTTIDVSIVNKSKRVQVWIGEGEYIRREGFFMRDGVDVYGGFPGKGGDPQSPGMKERKPTTSILETLTNDEVTDEGVMGTGQWGPQVDDYAHAKGFISEFDAISMTGWEVVDVSTQGVSGYYSYGETTWNGKAEFAIDDGNDALNTFWHSKYNIGDGTQTTFPHYVTVDMGVVNTFSTLRFVSRNYHPMNITFSYSTDNSTWIDINKDDIGNVNNNTAKDVTLSDTDISARYFKFIIRSNYNNSSFADVKDIKLGTGTGNSFSALSRATWNVIDYSSQEWGNNGEKYTPNYPNGYARHILDNKDNTYWQTQRNNGTVSETNPQFITVDLGSSYDFNTLKWQIRVNPGRSYKDVTVFSSTYSPKNEYINWTKHRKKYSCRLSQHDGGIHTLRLPETWTGRYVTLMVTDLYVDNARYPDIIELKIGNTTDDTFTALSCSMKVEDFSTEERFGESGGSTGMADHAVDNNTSTYWHTAYSGVSDDLAQYVVIDMKSEQTFKFIYFTAETKIKTITLFTSSDGTNFSEFGTFNLFKINSSLLELPSAITTRYVKIRFDEIYDTSSKAVKLYGIRFGTSGSYLPFYDLNSYANAYKTQRVLTQPYPYFKGKANINGSTKGNNLEFDNDPFNPFSVITSWDGFKIRNGRTKITHQRDGGAGVALRINGRLANCVITNNVLRASTNTRGGGIFQNGGIIENCKIDGNTLYGEGGNVYGGGLYQRTGTVFNTSVTRNKIKGSGIMQGTGVFFENGRFYNNTITANAGPLTLYSGKWFSNGRIDVYNSIIYNNTTNGSLEFDCSTTADSITLKNCLFNNSSAHKTFDSSYSKVDVSSFVYMGGNDINTLFNDAANGDYSLKQGAIAINQGTDILGKNMEGTADIVLPSYDANYDDRIQDCTVDIGAYEFNGAYSITPDLTTDAEKAVFYVTQNGRGTGSAADPANAACWTKLQKVLDAAGRYLQDNPEITRKVVVKLAGDAPVETTVDGKTKYQYSGFVYRPRRSKKKTAEGQEVNTRDYSIIVPHGIEVWGGYSDAFTDNDHNGFYTKNEDDTYTDNRDILKNRTTLSGIYQADDQDVNVYNVVTFTNNTYDEEGQIRTDEGGNDIGTDTLANQTSRAVLDGLFIENGNADGEKQSTGTRTDTRIGGGAIVTGYAHIRNCIVQDNKAADAGGGLYLEDGALVSGSIVQYNEVTKGDGGGLYIHEPTEEGDSTSTNPARIFTSNIIFNTASGAGGGMSFTTDKVPNVRANSVLFWRNTSSEQSNINGMTTPSDVKSANLTIKDYPISFCATETTREPGINNIYVNTDASMGVRFSTEDYNHDYTDSHGETVTRMHNQWEFYKIKKYSMLARGGMKYSDYATMVATYGLSEYDIADKLRTFEGNDFIDIGARAIDSLVLPKASSDKLMTRIFVVKNEGDVATTSVEVMQQQTKSEYYSQEGSSFAFPMRYLDDALQYVREARKLKKLNETGTDSIYAHKDQTFEIILSGGTYYPMRNIKGEYVNSRGRTYLVPEGVTIIGGVAAMQTDKLTRQYFYGNLATEGDLTDKLAEKTEFTFGSDTVVISHPVAKDIIKNRQLNDINHNNIAEPWEMAVQTILSGQVVNANDDENVYHVIACIADENHVGGLPKATIKYYDSDSEYYSADAGNGLMPYYRGVPVIIDGVEIIDGMAMKYDKDAVNSKSTYYKGGAICVEGNWTTGEIFKNTSVEKAVGFRNIPLEVRNCNFRNNGGNLGGAIFTDSELKVFACNFVQNYAEANTENVGGESITYNGNGGAINASFNTIIVNSLFANNQADTNIPNDGAPAATGVGGAIIVGDYASLHVINCDIVNNLAYAYPAIYCYKPNMGGKASDGSDNLKAQNPHKITNTIIWGNEVTAFDSGLNAVINYNRDIYDISKNAEALWFCAYEKGKGNEPVNSTNKIDYRLQTYSVFGTYIPELWTGKYNYLNSATNKIEKSTVDNADVIDGLNPVTCNIIIDSNNDAINGPNFINPSSKAGKAGYYTSADWMIGRINNLIDNGWTYLQQDLTGDDPVFVYEDDKVVGEGIYYHTAYDNKNVNTGETAVPIGSDTYMTYSDGTGKAMRRVSTDPNPTHHQTYIDLGVYEYQHVKLDPYEEDGHIDVIWVTQQEKTSASVADGKTWGTATSDMQRAIETLLASRNGHDKEIRMLEGNYQPVYTINNNLGFTISTDIKTGVVPPNWNGSGKEGVNSLTIKAGYSKDVEGLYNVSDYPAYMFASERSGVDPSLLGHVIVIGDVRQRMSIGTSGKTIVTDTLDYVIPIFIKGLTFCNVKSKIHEETDGTHGIEHGGAGLYYKAQYYIDEHDNIVYANAPKATFTTDSVSWWKVGMTDSEGVITGNELYKLSLSQCDFRINGKEGEAAFSPAVTIGKGGGESLIRNSVFHSNLGRPITAYDTKVLNCTFALNDSALQLKNSGLQHTVGIETKDYCSELHNSLLWRNNGNDIEGDFNNGSHSGCMTYNAITSLAADDTYNNVGLSEDNGNVLQGPNFINPELSASESWAKATRSFRVNPSAKVIGKASPKKYVELVKDITGSYPFTTTEVITNADDINDPYYHALVRQDQDLADNIRLYGSAGLERGAYECIATLSRVLYVNPERVSTDPSYNGFTWEKAYTKGNLQTAIDAAAVYSNVRSESAFVFVKGMTASAGEYISMRDNVTLYGSLPSTTVVNKGVTITTHEDGSTEYRTDSINAYIQRIDSERDGMASPYSKHTIVNGIGCDESLSYCLFDGLEIGSGNNDPISIATPAINITNGNVALRNTIIANNKMTTTGQPLVINNSGLLYNILIRNNTMAHSSDPIVSMGVNGYMLNCTLTGNEGQALWNGTGTSVNNIFYNEGDEVMPFAPYLRPLSSVYHAEIPDEDMAYPNLWYQLHERSGYINDGENGSYKNANNEYTGKGHVAESLRTYVDYSTDRDLLGNPRMLGATVDIGCYETWSTGVFGSGDDLHANTLSTSYNGHHYPHDGSVVYLQDGGNLICDLKADDKPYFTAANSLHPGYLLALEGGSLYGQGNSISLRYAAAERTINGRYALVALPFDMNYKSADFGGDLAMPYVTATAYDNANSNIVSETAIPSFDRYYYDGNARSKHDYLFSADNSTCWKPIATDKVTANNGMLIDRNTETSATTMRFTAYGEAAAVYPYTEYEDKDSVELTQYDYRTVNSNGSFEFTSSYNMGWNLKGMPYLISRYPTSAIDDNDRHAMHSPHVIYTMNGEGVYTPRQSWVEDSCSLSPGEAFFTQTATLNDYENLHFAHLIYSTPGIISAPRMTVNISLSSDNKTDNLFLILSDDNETSNDDTSLAYTINRDGAKFMSMSSEIPDIAVCGADGCMISLVGAAPADREIPLATKVGASRSYTFSAAGLTSDMPRALWLKDYRTGITVNLADEDYTVYLEGEDEDLGINVNDGDNLTSAVMQTGRFTLTIGGMRPDGNNRNNAAWTVEINGHHITVNGLHEGSLVTVCSLDGKVRNKGVSAFGSYSTDLSSGVYIITAEGKSVKVMIGC